MYDRIIDRSLASLSWCMPSWFPKIILGFWVVNQLNVDVGYVIAHRPHAAH